MQQDIQFSKIHIVQNEDEKNEARPKRWTFHETNQTATGLELNLVKSRGLLCIKVKVELN